MDSLPISGWLLRLMMTQIQKEFGRKFITFTEIIFGRARQVQSQP